MRIVSLLPSATEILFAIGAGDDVVGVTFECDSPPQARSKRIVSTSALPEGLDPASIDAAVSERIAAGEDLYHLDAGALADLDADLVVTQDLCAVCAVDVNVVDDALNHLGCTAQVLTTDPHTLEEVWESIEAIGEATGHLVEARRLVEGLAERLDVVEARLTPASAHRKPRTAVLEWTEPPFAPGHWIPEMVALAGGQGTHGAAGEPSVRTTWEAIAASDPEVIVAAPCGFDVEGALPLAQQVLTEQVEPLVAAGALRQDVQVWAVDANASFARPGPRLVDGVEALAAILHPDLFGEPEADMARRLR